MWTVGLINHQYFSLHSLFKKDLGMQLTHKECQFLARGLKYADNALGLSKVDRRRDITLNNNYSTQYPYELVEYACHLLLAFRERPVSRQAKQDVLIESIFYSLKV